MSVDQSESHKYIIHFHGEAKHIAIGDGARVELSPPPVGVPFQAPPLPAHFVPRPEASNALKARLLADEPTAPGVLVVSAIHGLGGIGKSTIAAALAYDRDVQERFAAGVLWVTLGQRPDLLPLLSAWIQALGDYSFHPTTANIASTHLRTLLQDKAALLVVDDVWDPGHVRHFLVGGADCQVLITTRRADVADEVGAGLHQLNVMTPVQSLALLSQRLGRELQGKEQKDALALAKTIGHLPLALELAAARVARGTSWTALLEALTEEIAQLEALEGPRRGRGKRHFRLEASFNLSLNTLRVDDEKAWEAFVWLGVLLEDATVAAPMVATLWDVPQDEAGEILELLWSDALLLPGSAQRIGERTWPTYRLHDLVHDLARRSLTDDGPDGRGCTLSEAHAVLLQRYRMRTSRGLWHTLPDDGYVHEHLTRHMEQAGEGEAIHDLLQEETAEGRNGWYEVRDKLNQVAGYMDDLRRAWHAAECHVEKSIQHDVVAPCLGMEIRYALCYTSIQTITTRVSPSLLVALVREGFWTPTRGIVYANLLPERHLRAEALVGLAIHLAGEDCEAVHEAALEAVRDLPDEGSLFRISQAEALTTLAPHLSEHLWQKALCVVQEIELGDRRAETLTGLLPFLPPSLIEEALGVALAIEPVTDRAEALAGLIPYLPEKTRAVVLSDYGDEILKAPIYLVADLLAPLVSEEKWAAAMKESLAAVRELSKSFLFRSPRAEVLVKLAPHLPKELLPEALMIALELPRWTGQNLLDIAFGRSPRAEALAGLAPHLPEELLIVGLVAALELPAVDFLGRSLRAEVLVRLVPYLSQDLVQKALEVVRELPDSLPTGIKPRTETLVRLASHLPRDEVLKTLKDALLSSREIGDSERQVKTLMGLTPHLSESLQDEVFQDMLSATGRIKDVRLRIETLSVLVPQLPRSLLGEAVAMAREAREVYVLSSGVI